MYLPRERSLSYIRMALLLGFISFKITVSGSQAIHSESDLPGSGPGTVGLTLSGGGGRGFAHVGVLYIIDSLGLKVDYISGTSIGSIIGALYASGYSASEIEEIVLSIDWEGVFGMKSNIEYVHIRKRKNHNKLVVELPLEDRQIRFRTGVVEGQHMWSLLEDFFFHVRANRDFKQFHVPFSCVATDLETGKQVVLDTGDIVSALRASMAVPAVLTAVERDDKVLLDGGVVNNFPVNVLKEMGAGFTIGVYVSEGLKSAGELQTPFEVIYQMGLFKDAEMTRENKEMTDLLISPDLQGYSSSDFTKVREIIELGKREARKHISDFQNIVRKQDIDPEYNQKKQTERARSIIVDSVYYLGLESVRKRFISNLADIQPGDTLHVDMINNLIDRYYATDYFERIIYNYSPSPNEPDRVNLSIYFSEKAPIHIDAAVHYNSFAGVGILAGISANRLLFYNMDTRVRLRLGEQPALRAGIDFFTGSDQRTWASIQTYGDIINFPVYEDFEITGGYEEGYLRLESTINRSSGQNTYFSAGAAFFQQRIKPTIIRGDNIRGRKYGYETFLNWNRYSVDQHSFPRKGQIISVEAIYYMGQKHSFNLTVQGESSDDLSAIDISIKNFLRTRLNWESYIPVNQRLTYYTILQAGYNFSYEQGFLKMFNLGGTYQFLRDQMVFAGLNEFEIITASAVTAGTGFHYNIWSEFYLTPLVNAAVYNFELSHLNDISGDQFVFGAGLSAGYLSLIGPIQVSFTYSPQTNNLLAYINLGWSF